MRDIKFRGKKFDNGEWIYGCIIGGASEGLPVIVGDDFDVDDDYIRLNTWCSVDTSTVGQFTGLLDKNNKEVYEGDIVEGNWLGGTRKGNIVFIEEIASFGVLFEGRETPCAILNKLDWFTKNYDFQCEVIGTIYETPELLEAN